MLTDDGVTGILLVHPLVFGSGELKRGFHPCFKGIRSEMNVPCRAAVVLALQPEHQKQLFIARRSLLGKRRYPDNCVARTLKKLHPSKGDYCIKQ